MNNKSRTKLTEECGELVTILAKIEAFGGFGEHWDGKGNLQKRLEGEIADVLASCIFAIDINGLDYAQIDKQMQEKVLKFEYWESGGREIVVPLSYFNANRNVELRFIKI